MFTDSANFSYLPTLQSHFRDLTVGLKGEWTSEEFQHLAEATDPQRLEVRTPYFGGSSVEGYVVQFVKGNAFLKHETAEYILDSSTRSNPGVWVWRIFQYEIPSNSTRDEILEFLRTHPPPVIRFSSSWSQMCRGLLAYKY
jgi:hypothetical protein